MKEQRGGGRAFTASIFYEKTKLGVAGCLEIVDADGQVAFTEAEETTHVSGGVWSVVVDHYLLPDTEYAAIV